MFHSLCHMVDQDGNPKNKVCPECDTVFKVPIGLKHHLLLHTGELPFLCLHCWRSFSSHIDLKLHIRREHLFHLDMPTTKQNPTSPKVKKMKGENVKEELKSGEFIAVAAEGETLEGEAEGGQQVQFVMAAEGEDHEEGQTIVLNSDAAASYVDSNGQDMIVVIQSDDFDQSQGMSCILFAYQLTFIIITFFAGLIVVDPSQLQQITGGAQIQGTAVTSSGLTIATPSAAVATATTSDGQEMIVSDQTNESNSQDEYISLQMPDGTSQMVLAQREGGEGGEYILVEQPEQKQTSFIQDSLNLA